MATIRCAQCGEPFDTTQTEAMPFCSRRCKLIDLGRWLSEENTLPHVPDPDDFDDELPEESWN